MQHSVAHSKCCKDEQMREGFSLSSAPGTDALEYYSQVQDAARRRVDSAESLYNELNDFFRRGTYKGEEPTEKKVLRDMKALMYGRKDGKVVVENVKPKMTGGKHKVIDEKFTDSAECKETKNGSITE
jgi:hypothetical protein